MQKCSEFGTAAWPDLLSGDKPCGIWDFRGIIDSGSTHEMDTHRRAQGPEEGSAAELWRHTIGQIPSSFGRLVYLASLRDQNTGRYEHHGLSQMFGEDESDGALRQSHDQTFAEWLRFDLQQQKNDLDMYLSAFQVEKRTILATWIRLAPYRNLMPTNVREPERRLYLADIETILELLQSENDVAIPDPDE
jgi:hypothetical protein